MKKIISAQWKILTPFSRKLLYEENLEGVTVLPNDLIAKDEALHTQFGIMIYNEYIVNKLTENEIMNIFMSAVWIEEEYVNGILQTDLIGINSKLMIQYVHAVADNLLIMLKCKKLYNETNPFEWMEMMGVQSKANFFEKQVANYQKSVISSLTYDFDNNDF